jgi:hypothetical protein
MLYFLVGLPTGVAFLSASRRFEGISLRIPSRLMQWQGCVLAVGWNKSLSSTPGLTKRKGMTYTILSLGIRETTVAGSVVVFAGGKK